MSAIRKLLLTGLCTGYLPASGTWGSLITCGVFLAAAYGLRAANPQLAPEGVSAGLDMAMLLLLAAAMAICVGWGEFAEKAFGAKDPRQVNADEVAGQAVALLFMPMTTGAWRPAVVAAIAFVAFRFFDILKPPPIRRLEKLPQGWGVLADDLLAGAFANVVTQLLLRLVVLNWAS